MKIEGEAPPAEAEAPMPAAEDAGYDNPDEAVAAETAALATQNKLDVEALPIRQYLAGGGGLPELNAVHPSACLESICVRVYAS